MASVISHFEVHVDDIARAKKFYADVFGWPYHAMGTLIGAGGDFATNEQVERTYL
jgi:predicted enzyme related to lactoylglutathione lyase